MVCSRSHRFGSAIQIPQRTLMDNPNSLAIVVIVAMSEVGVSTVRGMIGTGKKRPISEEANLANVPKELFELYSIMSL
jgi:hypothetical protein